jgi:hypothetical protein
MMIHAAPAAETNAGYHADYTHVGHSMLEVYLESPALYQHRYILRDIPPDEPTPEMVLGSLTHCLTLQGTKEADRLYQVAVGYRDHRGNAWKEFRDDALAHGRETILESQWKHAWAMRDAVLSHHTASKLLAMPGIAERPIRWTHRSGVACKCRPDWLILDDRIDWAWDVDLKTAADPRPEAFARQVSNLGYYRGAAHYADGIATMTTKPAMRLFIVVGKQPPHDVYVYQLDGTDVDAGRSENHYGLTRLALSMASGQWEAPGQRDVQLLTLPAWARRHT